MQILLATNNAHKVEEIAHTLGEAFQIITLQQMGFEGDIEETGSTLAENSLLKAQVIYSKYGINCLADDSGLEVEALHGAPGVYSARYAGQHGNHDANMNLLLKNLEGVPKPKAQFKTVLTLILQGVVHQFEGTVAGTIVNEKRGNLGFGYDPIFVPDGFDKTFAEMTLDQKTSLSHRSRALEKLCQFLKTNH